ncbi:hypothetical protein STAS_14119 [Striga asiatica]|uniref:Uncharacterized protein n=1 Tax=Striga asiatica TaxID=4170 RepID=A0A5A7PY88_STRAF|nr:hypothetical protein STAS_14119 [Striga asiatica]
MSETRDPVLVHFESMLRRQPTTTSSSPSIFRVDRDNRQGSENLYEPKLVSIGPYYHQTAHLQKMEARKLAYLKCLVKRCGESTFEECVAAVWSLEEKARKSYSEPIELPSPEQMVKILVFDGIFVVELLRKIEMVELREMNDPIFQYQHFGDMVGRDLMLVENQVPFFVLHKLFTMTRSKDDPYGDILFHIRDFAYCISPWDTDINSVENLEEYNKNHLLGLVYQILFKEIIKADRPVDEEIVERYLRRDSELQQETRDHVSDDIYSLILQLPSSPSSSPTFDDDSENLYNPKFVSIGPFHHQTPHLQKMQPHKLAYLKGLLARRDESTVNRYVVAVRSLEEKARNSYSKPIELDQDEHVKILVVDGLFVVELLRKNRLHELREMNDPIFGKGQYVLDMVLRDLMLVENQVPFFVLLRLFAMTRGWDPWDDIFHLLRCFAHNISLSAYDFLSTIKPEENNTDNHLLGVVCKILFGNLIDEELVEKRAEIKRSNCLNVTFVYKNLFSLFGKLKAQRPVGLKFLAVSKLQETGVEFKRTDGSIDITFDGGVLRIPRLGVDEHTESVLRNLITYEQFLTDYQPSYVTDHITFLKFLVKRPTDVQILRRHGILENFLGQDQMVCNVFRSLGKNEDDVDSWCDFRYTDVQEAVNRYCNRRVIRLKAVLRRWMAELWQKYFNSPWSFIKFCAAYFVGRSDLA